MSPQTTRVSLESTVDTVLSPNNKINCIQCKRKKKRETVVFSKNEKEHELVVEFQNDQISDIKTLYTIQQEQPLSLLQLPLQQLRQGAKIAGIWTVRVFANIHILGHNLMSRLVFFIFPAQFWLHEFVLMWHYSPNGQAVKKLFSCDRNEWTFFTTWARGL